MYKIYWCFLYVVKKIQEHLESVLLIFDLETIAVNCDVLTTSFDINHRKIFKLNFVI